MKPEEYKTFQKDIDTIYSDFIRVKQLLSVVMGSVQQSAEPTGEELDALDATVDYFNRIMDNFDAVMNPPVLPGQEVPA